MNNLYFTRNARWLALGAFASFLTAIGMALTATAEIATAWLCYSSPGGFSSASSCWG